MKTTKAIIIILAVLLLCSSTFAETNNGPFGIKWGASVKELKSMGIKLKISSESEGRFTIYTSSKLPKNLSMAEQYVLLFDKQFKLQKVMMISEDITGDVYGSEGKETYSTFKSKLQKKYGAPTVEFERVGMALYDESDEFYQCLAYAGCGRWASVFETSDTTISIELKGKSRGSGCILLTYEGPSWSKAVDAMKSSTSKSDNDAL